MCFAEYFVVAGDLSSGCLFQLVLRLLSCKGSYLILER